MLKVCKICGNNFMADSNHAKFCNDCKVYIRRAYQRRYYHKMTGTEEKPKRYSGLEYINPPEKVQAIKEKYKNGVSYKMILQML